MSKHTKGPWITKRFIRENAWERLRARVETEDGEIIAELFDSAFSDQNHINACLIAAAPELLESLKETLSCIDQHTDDPILGPIIESAKRAIAKAEGE